MNTYTPIIVGIIRHCLALLGAGGMFSEGDISQLAGAVLVLVSAGWSIYEKWKPQPLPPDRGDYNPVPRPVAPSKPIRKAGKRDR
jgi:hypothetical protein